MGTTPGLDRGTRSYTGRLDRLQALISERHLDVAVITDPVNVRYLCGYWTILSRASPEALIVHRSRDPILVIPALETDAAREQAPAIVDIRGWRQYEMKAGGSTIPPVPFAARAREAIDPQCRRVGVERGHVTAAALEQLADTSWELVDITGFVAEMRARKEREELLALRRAAEITAEACAAMIQAVRPGTTEHSLAAVGAEVIHRVGGRVTHLVIGSGPRSAFPHPLPTGRVLEEGDLVLFDLGVEFDDYWAEIARTVVAGSPSPEARGWFHLVVEAQRAGARALRPGANGGDVDAAVRRTLAAAGFNGTVFTHSAGHGLGLLGADMPYIYPQSAEQVVTPSVISLEPGLYFGGRGGIRVEDAFFVDEGKVERWTDLPQQLEGLGNSLGEGN